jgi:hypothetical protein
VTVSISRRELLKHGVRGGAAVAVAGSAVGALAGTAGAAAPPTTDLAYVRLLVGAELLASDFYSQAIAASNSSAAVMKYLKTAYFNEQQHYQSVSGILSGALVTPAVSGDFTFTYPDGTFATEASIVKFASQIESTVLGAYLGAIGAIQTQAWVGGLAQIAANEGQHLSYFQARSGQKTFGLSFPPALNIADASNAFAAYTA